MKKHVFTFAASTLLLMGVAAQPASAQRGGSWVYEIKITNITKGTDLTQGLVFTPILLATHAPNAAQAFELGEVASDELAMLAEGGDTAPLAQVLENTAGVRDVTTTDGPLLPGQSVELELPYAGRRAQLSMASMLLPTNDGFIGLNGSRLPFYRNQSVTYYSPGYDAGSEVNDELCASIPGPHCGGEGYSPDAGEGLIHVHSGIHGVGDLTPENYEWHNPVVKVTVKLVRR